MVGRDRRHGRCGPLWDGARAHHGVANWTAALRGCWTRVATSAAAAGGASTTSSGSTWTSSRRSASARTPFPATPYGANSSSTSSASSARRSPTSRQIHFSTAPASKYETFASGLHHQAPRYYAEADGDVGYATPDAVIISTVHQAKGMQWPAVFLPCLRANRFPAQRHRWTRRLPRHPAERDRRRGPLQGDARGRDAAVLRRSDPGQKYLYVDLLAGHEPAATSSRSEFFDHCTRQPLGIDPRSRRAPRTTALEPHAQA